MGNPKIDPELYRRLWQNSDNWQKMLDILTQETLMSEDDAKLYLVVLGYDPGTDENEMEDEDEQ